MKYIETEKRDNRRIHRRIMRWPLAFWIGAAFLLGVSQLSFGAAWIWDNDTTNWTTTFANGDPIDTGKPRDAVNPQVAIDSDGIVYVAYRQADAAGINRIYLSRYDGTDVRIWDDDTSNWTTTFANGDPIDTGTGNNALNPQVAIDSNDIVYVTYAQRDVQGLNHIYLSRYDGTDVRIWDNDTSNWTTTFANGDPIDTGTPNHALNPQLAIDLNNRIYVTYSQFFKGHNHIYLSRYDGTDATDPKVEIWDNDTTDWITTFANGDPIDTGTGNAALHPQLATDRQDKVYVTYYQSLTGHNHIYLSRYDGTDATDPKVEIWDNDATDWTTTFANGDPIDTGTDNSAYNPQVVVDLNNRIYVTYSQFFEGHNHIYLSSYVDDPQSPSQPQPPSGGGGGGGCFVGTVVDGFGW